MNPASASASASASERITHPNIQPTLLNNFTTLNNSSETLETNAASSLLNTLNEVNPEVIPSIQNPDSKINSLLSTKSENIKEQESDALSKFLLSLSPEIPIQNTLLDLSVKQLSILLPYTYVEASHPLNPLIAYNKPDTGTRYSEALDDNVLMIKSYALFLSDLNAIFNSHQCDEAKIACLSKSIQKIIALILYGDPKIQTYMHENYPRSFSTPSNAFVNETVICEKIKRQTDEFHEREHKDNKIPNDRFMNNFKIGNFSQNISVYFDENKNIEISSSIEAKYKLGLLNKLSTELLSSYNKKDLLNIFKLTSDFMYLHMLPNANGRISQVLRDCFALMLNEAPFPALTPMSHYMYIDSMPDQTHLSFMQSLFFKRLDMIKKNEFQDLLSESTINSLLTEYNENEALDIDFKLYKICKKENDNLK